MDIFFDEKQYKNKLLDTFKAFDSFCLDHNIKYYAAYGTLIGAIRHNGLIPWDDDIDVWMLPDDYNRFCSFKGKVGGHYDIMDSRDDNYWLFSLAKFVDCETTLWEYECFPCITGLYIDIFPLTELKTNNAVQVKADYDTITSKLTSAIRHQSLSQYYTYLNNKHYGEICRGIRDFFYSTCRNSLKQKYSLFVKKISGSLGDRLVSLDGPYKVKEIYNKDWFSELERVSFEDTEINIPKNYSDILAQLYGDYMQLPPEDKRVPHHSHYFLDLDRRWTIEEIIEYKKKH